ncbi:MAG: FAD-binding oxidoreductase [Gammaproteobacteria bacterium]|nr:FAD-binding oxidoreductase [Gammaproteobacteria bacterium]
MIVVGAGIVGASIAYHLACHGVSVTVIDRDSPVCGASGKSFAWINASYPKQPFSYHLLSRLGALAYRRLQTELDLDIRWGGSIQWSDRTEQQGELRQGVERQQSYGMPVQMIPMETARKLEPNVDLRGATEVAYSELDAAIDAPAAVRELLAAAERHGARVVFHCELTGIRVRSGKLAGIDTSRGAMVAERLIVAGGVATHELAAMVGVEFAQAPTAGIIATTAPIAPLVNTVVVAPGVYIRQRHDGRVVLGEPSGPPRPSVSEKRVHGERIMAAARRYVPGLGGAAIESVTIGWRPMPLDGKPIVGAPDAFPDIYLAVMHSGVSLAGVVGQLAALELIDGSRSELLDAYRVERFHTG